MRCYNGCPDTELQALIDDNARIRAAAEVRGFHITWFPMGEFYQAFDSNHRPVTGECGSLPEVERALSGL